MTRSFLTVSALTFALLLLVSLPQLADPLIRFDDFPAFFGDEHLFYEKTLSEGRWLNYWWIARPFIWSPTVNFMIYQLAWAIFAAAAAVNALGPGARPLHTIALAALIALSPQAFLISGWFNTLILGAWVVALYAVISLYVSGRTARWLFLIFAPVSMMAYSTYPLLLIALCLTRHDARRSVADLVGLIALLGFGIGLGMLLMYTINHFAHGVFGIAIAEWREPTPATSLEALRANAERLLPTFLGRLFVSSAFGITAIGVLNVALLVGAFALLVAKRPLLVVYIAAGIGVSVSLVAVHSVKEGVDIPMRALISVWVFFAIAVVRAVAALETEGARNRFGAALVVLIALYAGQIHKHSGLFMTWQKESRAIAEAMPDDVEAIFVYGDVSRLRGVVNAYIHHPTGLTERIRLFTGIPTFPCDMTEDVTCKGEPPFDVGAAAAELLIEVVGRHAVVRLPSHPRLAENEFQADNR